MAKLLIVDDDMLNSKIYSTKLQKDQHQVHLSLDGQDALEKIKDKFDLILLDIMLPKIDGLNLLKEIKKGINKNTTVLLYTNLMSQDAKKEALENGAKEFILKADLNPLELLEKIKNYLPPSS
ncbi:response regulator [Patescibacteria group bacterium]|nr:response regulator [Patescibacteria group bacterium]MCG2702231.1 response regulator [Candidatus Parcubacteria bacterium]MBU4210013.1 response regulator [Patescibacteria group bacterium]MBU4264755.1 response regulator [Patescibacteria group bacterium]MBU4390093.1 response regulator [Patescibacteria group bacterium]